MATVQMNSNSGVTGTVNINGTNISVSLSNGIGAVNAENVRLAIAAGWTVMPGEDWPNKEIRHMTPPTNGAWPSNGTVTAPDGTSISISSGIALVPRAWISYYRNLGWSATGWGE